MNNNPETVKAALRDQPGRYLLKELGTPHSALKGVYCSLREADGSELAQLAPETIDLLARQGVVKARPFADGAYRFEQL